MSPGHDDFSATEILESEPPKRRRVPRPLMLAALTAVVVTAGAGVAFATTDSPSPGTPAPTATASGSPEPSESPSARQDESGPRGRGGWGWGPRMFGGGIHGEYVVPGEREGQWVTVATQVGEVTAVGQNSVTVKSEDGYTREYAVNSDTRINSSDGISAIKTGHRVAVSARVDGGTATARTILDADLRPENSRRHWWGDRWGDRGDRGHRDGEDRGRGGSGGSDTTPSPSASTTA